MFTRIREIWQNYKAWRRGERRVAARGARGRIYEQKNPPPSAAHEVKTKTTYTTLARVIRADGSPDEHFNLTENMKLSSADFDTLRGGMNHG